MAVLVAASLWWTGTRLLEVAGPIGAGTGELAQVFEAEHETVEENYTTAIARLEEVTSVERATLDPGTADVLDAGLIVIDEAIDESRAVLEMQPDNALAQASLFAALRSKVAVQQQMLALIHDVRHGNEDAAAGMLPELNQ
jgi:hypothetical protein